MLTSITPGSGVTLKLLQPRIAAGRRIAFDEHRLAEFLGGVLDRGDQVEIVLGALGRRHEDVEMAVARLERHRACARCRRRTRRRRACWLSSGASARRQTSARDGVAVAVALRRSALPAGAARGARRKASSGGSVGMGDHRIGLGDEVRCPPAPPTAANRAAGDSRSANRRGSGSTSRVRRNHGPLRQRACRLRCARARNRQHVADRRSRGPSRTRAPGARAPADPSTLAGVDRRRCPAAAARARGSTRCPRRPRTDSRDRAAGAAAKASAKRLRDLGRGAGRLGFDRRQRCGSRQIGSPSLRQ